MFFLRLDLRGGWGRIPIGGTLVIGRSNTADLILDSPTISRVHCRLCVEGEHLHVEPLGEGSNTQINGRPVEGKTELSLGDWLHVGTFTLIIEDESRQSLARPKRGISAQATADDLPVPAALPAESQAAVPQATPPATPTKKGLSSLHTADDITPPELPLDAPPTTDDFVPPAMSGETPPKPREATREHRQQSTIIIDESALYEDD